MRVLSWLVLCAALSSCGDPRLDCVELIDSWCFEDRAGETCELSGESSRESCFDSLFDSMCEEEFITYGNGYAACVEAMSRANRPCSRLSFELGYPRPNACRTAFDRLPLPGLE